MSPFIVLSYLPRLDLAIRVITALKPLFDSKQLVKPPHMKKGGIGGQPSQRSHFMETILVHTTFFFFFSLRKKKKEKHKLEKKKNDVNTSKEKVSVNLHHTLHLML